MINTQLGRRNLPPQQRIAVVKKGETLFDKKIHTDKELAKMAGVGTVTYRMGAKVLNSDNENVKQRVLSGETFISAGYKELMKIKGFYRNEYSSARHR